MCFCAEASFAAGSILLSAGVYCTRVAIRDQPTQLPLAVVPLLFSFQQFAEGFVWIGLTRENEALVTAGSLGFLAVALGLWPFWVSFSLLFLERRSGARQLLGASALAGLVFGCLLYVPLALNTGEWLKVGLAGHSIRYNLFGLPVFEVIPHEWWDVGYGALVLLPLLLASADARFLVFFLLLAAAGAISLFVYRNVFVSVWCYFAAILSLQLCCLFSRPRKAVN